MGKKLIEAIRKEYMLQPGAPILLDTLRKSMDINRELFDDALIQIVKSGDFFLSKHFYPASASAEEKEGYIPDGEGNFYVAISPRDHEAFMKPLLPCETTVNDVPEKKRSARGGIREGAGRHCIKLKDKRVGLGFARVPAWLSDWLKAEGDCGRKIEQALISHFKLKMPESKCEKSSQLKTD